MKKKLQNYTDKRGNLFSYYKKNLKFNRVFFITGKKNKIRGDHAHKSTKQIIINVNAKAELIVTNKRKVKKIKFISAGEFIEVPKMTWVRIQFNKEGYIAVICDKKYLKNDYINDFKEFKIKLKNNKY